MTTRPSTQLRTPLQPSQPTITATTTTSVGSTPVTTLPVMPVTHGGTVFYVPQRAVTGPTHIPAVAAQPSSFSSATSAPLTPSSAVLQPSPTHFSLQEVAQLLASTKKDHLQEWKVFQYKEDPIQWHKWFGLADLSDNSGYWKCQSRDSRIRMYKDPLKTLELTFGQPETVVTAHLDKLANNLPVKMHNSESIIHHYATVSSLVEVFRPLNYVQDFSSTTSLGQAVQKRPPNMKEGWAMHTVKRSLDRPTLIDFQ